MRRLQNRDAAWRWLEARSGTQDRKLPSASSRRWGNQWWAWARTMKSAPQSVIRARMSWPWKARSISTSCPPDSVGDVARCLARVTSLSRRGPKRAPRMPRAPRVPQAISRTSLTCGWCPGLRLPPGAGRTPWYWPAWARHRGRCRPGTASAGAYRSERAGRLRVVSGPRTCSNRAFSGSGPSRVRALETAEVPATRRAPAWTAPRRPSVSLRRISA